MRRRGFLTVTALGTGALAIGCGGVHGRTELAVSDARALAGRLQRGMRLLDDRPFGSLVQGPPASRPDLTEHVLRLTMESFLVLDVLRALPDDVTVPPVLGEVLAPMLPRLDRAVHTHHALLARMPAQRSRNLDRRLRAQPELAMDAASWLDERARDVGVPLDNRLRLRQSAVTVGTRMRRQSTNAVVADCVAKLDESFVQRSPLPAELAASTARVVDVMWQQVDESQDAIGWGAPVASTEAPTPPALSGDPYLVPQRFGASREMDMPTEPVQWNDSWARPGDEEIRLGAILMPLGLVTCGLTLIAGLIVLIAGEAQNGEWDGATHADDASVQ